MNVYARQNNLLSNLDEIQSPAVAGKFMDFLKYCCSWTEKENKVVWEIPSFGALNSHAKQIQATFVLRVCLVFIP